MVDPIFTARDVPCTIVPAFAFPGAYPRPYDLPCVQISKSDDLDNACAKINAFWHKRLQCKSYQSG
jgi:hypothetical protein